MTAQAETSNLCQQVIVVGTLPLKSLSLLIRVTMTGTKKSRILSDKTL
jgi:hypothetical protein